MQQPFPLSPIRPAGDGNKNHVSEVHDTPPVEIGPAVNHLRQEMLGMYWRGVERELSHILLTLCEWQTNPDYPGCVLPDEQDRLVCGYDTFLDQVSQTSRQFAQRPFHAATISGRPPSYAQVAEERAWEFYAGMKATQVKQSVREALSQPEEESIVRRRARLLLQSAQFLDIDKMIEYRDRQESQRPAPPQLMASAFDEVGLPILAPQQCSQCYTPIRSSVFASIHDDRVAICEGCYRRNHFGQPSFAKQYKSCCLPRTITPRLGRKVCHCPDLPRRDENGRLHDIWPFAKPADAKLHVHGHQGSVSCGLTRLPNLVAEAKFAGTRLKTDGDSTLSKFFEEDREQDKVLASRYHRGRETVAEMGNMTTLDLISDFPTSKGSIIGSSGQVPRYLGPSADAHPFGNAHMALRIGPIVIENGIADVRGALITTRDPPELHAPHDSLSGIERSLLLTGNPEKRLYSQLRSRTSKRYKAVMKQVVGGAFCGLFDKEMEDDIVDALLNESRDLADGVAATVEVSHPLNESTSRLMVRLKRYLSSRIEAYLSSIASRLLDSKVDLCWHPKLNDCQTFCESLIDRQVFGPLVASPDPSTTYPAPLYLMSFVCRPGAYTSQQPMSKFDVPSGLTEEYLLKSTWGRHEEVDIIDSLAEYWNDWGGFEGPI
ncbi:hypothetical protein B0I35DRAFT_480940 [Stachybotrys elegans]|uniref:Uncharacterized protein n=1 Tax=Stachybotrys elegans TaxID=80388 RepID=A0A8K0SK31_9HYPO|nr:hypothetical protein B0I35DRAFT_480940 [Stachybotrys elegans]